MVTKSSSSTSMQVSGDPWKNKLLASPPSDRFGRKKRLSDLADESIRGRLCEPCRLDESGRSNLHTATTAIGG